MSPSLLVRGRRLRRHLDQQLLFGRFPLVNALVVLVHIIAMSRLIATFNSSYEQRPLLTMMISNSILNGLADTAAQTVTAIRQRAVRKPLGPDPSTDPLAIEIHSLDEKIPDSLSPNPTNSNRIFPSSSSSNQGGLIPPSSDLPPPFDFERLARFMVWGFAMAPLQFTWFKILSRSFPISATTTSAISTTTSKPSAFSQSLKRVGCDQFIFAPIGLAMFFTYMTVAEGGRTKEVKRKFERVYIPALRSNYVLWPAVQIINFRLMPIQFQLPFVSTVGIFWTTYLSLTNSAAEV